MQIKYAYFLHTCNKIFAYASVKRLPMCALSAADFRICRRFKAAYANDSHIRLFQICECFANEAVSHPNIFKIFNICILEFMDDKFVHKENCREIYR